MKYPKRYSLREEPEEIRKGDLVWWNEGSCVGFIEEVMEAVDDYKSWGLDAPSIALTNLHPFEANGLKHKQHVGSPMAGGTTVNSADQLEDEGVSLLTPHERSEFDWAISEAKKNISSSHRSLPYCVCAVKNRERNWEDWHFHFVDQECQAVESVVIPFRPNTRTKWE